MTSDEFKLDMATYRVVSLTETSTFATKVRVGVTKAIGEAVLNQASQADLVDAIMTHLTLLQEEVETELAQADLQRQEILNELLNRP